VSKLAQEKEKFVRYLNKTGVTLTHGRQTVFDEAMKAHGHFAPEELVKQCQSHHRRVSRATVYRGLNELLEAGLIRKTAFGEKHQHFEHIYDEKPHHHARCIRCGIMIEFPDLKEDKVYTPLLEQQKFKILGHEMHFYGICKNCQSGK
jgi:Fur family ferric uptake transcriptional regulator